MFKIEQWLFGGDKRKGENIFSVRLKIWHLDASVFELDADGIAQRIRVGVNWSERIEY